MRRVSKDDYKEMLERNREMEEGSSSEGGKMSPKEKIDSAW